FIGQPIRSLRKGRGKTLGERVFVTNASGIAPGLINCWSAANGLTRAPPRSPSPADDQLTTCLDPPPLRGRRRRCCATRQQIVRCGEKRAFGKPPRPFESI